MKKKRLALVVTPMLCLGLVASCGGSNPGGDTEVLQEELTKEADVKKMCDYFNNTEFRTKERMDKVTISGGFANSFIEGSAGFNIGESLEDIINGVFDKPKVIRNVRMEVGETEGINFTIPQYLLETACNAEYSNYYKYDKETSKYLYSDGKIKKMKYLEYLGADFLTNPLKALPFQILSGERLKSGLGKWTNAVSKYYKTHTKNDKDPCMKYTFEIKSVKDFANELIEKFASEKFIFSFEGDASFSFGFSTDKYGYINNINGYFSGNNFRYKNSHGNFPEDMVDSGAHLPIKDVISIIKNIDFSRIGEPGFLYELIAKYPLLQTFFVKIQSDGVGYLLNNFMSSGVGFSGSAKLNFNLNLTRTPCEKNTITFNQKEFKIDYANDTKQSDLLNYLNAQEEYKKLNDEYNPEIGVPSYPFTIKDENLNSTVTPIIPGQDDAITYSEIARDLEVTSEEKTLADYRQDLLGFKPVDYLPDVDELETRKELKYIEYDVNTVFNNRSYTAMTKPKNEFVSLKEESKKEVKDQKYLPKFSSEKAKELVDGGYKVLSKCYIDPKLLSVYDPANQPELPTGKIKSYLYKENVDGKLKTNTYESYMGIIDENSNESVIGSDYAYDKDTIWDADAIAAWEEKWGDIPHPVEDTQKRLRSCAATSYISDFKELIKKQGSDLEEKVIIFYTDINKIQDGAAELYEDYIELSYFPHYTSKYEVSIGEKFINELSRKYKGEQFVFNANLPYFYTDKGGIIENTLSLYYIMDELNSSKTEESGNK